MKPVLIHGAARAELDDAIAFYESRAHGLGRDLQAKVEDAVAQIRRRPEAWPPHKDGGFRKYLLMGVISLMVVVCIQRSSRRGIMSEVGMDRCLGIEADPCERR